MYEHNDYLGQPYQAAPSSFTDPGETMPNEVHYEPTTNTFSQNTAAYAVPLHDLDRQQQQFLSISPDVAYQTIPATGFAQSWLATPDPSIFEAPIDQFQLPQPQQQQDPGPVTTWPSLPHCHSRSSEDGAVNDEIADGSDGVPNKKKERKERRRAQNRVAQRLFRARREVSLKENSQRLESLEDEVARLQSNNKDLSIIVKKLRDEVVRLRRENLSLKQRASDSLRGEEGAEKMDAAADVDGDVSSIFEHEEMRPFGSLSKGKSSTGREADSLSGVSHTHIQDKGSFLTKDDRNKRRGTQVSVVEIPSKFV